MEYDATEASRGTFRVVVDWVRNTLLRSKEKDEFEGRYRKRGWLGRMLWWLIPGRVSRIHLYEAQERYVYLWRTLEFYEPDVSSSNGKNEERTIRICRDILKSTSGLLTRRQHDLKFLWREMTLVHIMMLEKVIPADWLPAQLDFCREESRRLATTKDPEINESIQRLSEIMDRKDENRLEKVRILRILLERFTTIRAGRIHEQFINIQCYLKAFFTLVPIAVILVANDHLLVGKPTVLLQFPTADFSGGLGVNSLYELGSFIPAFVVYLLTSNLLAFVFLAGLTGGFFSVTIRMRGQELIPGEDAYFNWYVLTKPWMGALGAAILYILLQAGFVQFDLGDTAGKLSEPGAALFGFGFLAGFSERIVFPSLKYG